MIGKRWQGMALVAGCGLASRWPLRVRQVYPQRKRNSSALARLIDDAIR